MKATFSRRQMAAAGALGAFGMAAGRTARGEMTCSNYERLGLHQPFRDGTINGRSNREILDSLDVPEDAQYNPCAEAHPPGDAARGTIRRIEAWDASQIYADTVRDLYLYTPPGLTQGAEPALMVFQDGAGYAAGDGPVRAPAVLDTLLHRGEIEPTVAVFVNPGRPRASPQGDNTQRSTEYDTLDGRYAEFLVSEVLPFAEREIGHAFTRDAQRRTICGISSGGICAFNAAWHAPEAFGRVLSHCGSFVNIKGGHNYPYLVRATERKPLKVFLTSGVRDANIILGSWPLANQQMAASLEYAGYEFRFEFGEGGHSLRHGGALFAESLRWLWS